MDFNEAAILFALNLSHQPSLLCSLDEPDHSVVAPLQKLCKFGNCSPATARITRHAQHKLVLLWGDSARAGHPFAKTQKAPDAVAKLCKLRQRAGAVEGCL